MPKEGVDYRVISFKFGEEDFKVIFKVNVNSKGEITSVSSASKIFFEFMQSINMVRHSEDCLDWFNSINNSTTLSSSDKKKSLMLRKKALLVGLKVIYGDAFTKHKEKAFKI